MKYIYDFHYFVLQIIVSILWNDVKLVFGREIARSPILSKSTRSEAITSYVSKNLWVLEAQSHAKVIMELLYPNDGYSSLKQRKHAVHAHPIYNFLHTYYRYSADNLMVYSQGIDNVHVFCDVEDIDHKLYFNSPSYRYHDHQVSIDIEKLYQNHNKLDMIQKYYNILLKTSIRVPSFGCFGFHEWAMLYSGQKPYQRESDSQPLPKHQKHLDLRVSQQTIDDVINSNALKCTHFDAWRFFHPRAQPMNSNAMLSRQSQADTEQPGCIHATMDIFKYAYSIYPYIPSSQLRDCLMIAIAARIIDMRASPYDVTSYDLHPICVETMKGRREYARLQEELYTKSQPVRLALLTSYQYIIDKVT